MSEQVKYIRRGKRLLERDRILEVNDVGKIDYLFTNSSWKIILEYYNCGCTEVSNGESKSPLEKICFVYKTEEEYEKDKKIFIEIAEYNKRFY